MNDTYIKDYPEYLQVPAEKLQVLGHEISKSSLSKVSKFKLLVQKPDILQGAEFQPNIEFLNAWVHLSTSCCQGRGE